MKPQKTRSSAKTVKVLRATRASIQTTKAPRARPARYKLDPEYLQMNERRAAWAKKSINLFCKLTGAEPETAVRDLLHGLMHLCDRNFSLGDFDDELDLAFQYYAEFTAMHIEEEPPNKIR